jgi:NAD(P)-dependent dehydrogenase (short-subunit alcohol dehydrogenase family)
MGTVLITGASSGIGKATVEYFAMRNWQVVATMRRPEKSPELAALENVLCLRLDVSDLSSIESAIDQAIAHFGKIDVIVNNAGYGAVGAFEAANVAEIQAQFDTNVFGLMNVTRAILPHFRQRRQGMVINISSIGGRLAFPIYSLYHATKWAVEGFSESLQYELLPFNIQVKLIEPGAIKTDFYSRSQTIFAKADLTDYEAYQSRVLAKIQKVEENAPLPIVVAKTIYQAATDNSDRLRYSVGNGVPLLLLLRRIFPHSWFRAIVQRSLG